MDAFLPITLFFLGLIVWGIGFIFFEKRFLGPITIGSSIFISIGILMLLRRGYSSLVVILLCIVGLLVIMYFGFDISFRKVSQEGPFGVFFDKKGTALTYLDPKGQIVIEGQTVPAMTEGLMIPAGTAVRVIRCGKKFVVVETTHE